MDSTVEAVKLFLSAHIVGDYRSQIISLLTAAGIFATAVAAYYVCKWILYLVGIAIDKTPTKWDDDLIDHRLMRAVSQLAPALTVNWLLPAFFRANEFHYVRWITVLTSFYILWAVVRILVIFIENLFKAMSARRRTRPYAVKGIFQMLKLIAIGLGIIVGISILIGKEPVAILTALGASAAILMLVFKDTILGLVASVQLTANKMLHKGDWIVAEKHGANGEVEDVSLTTVKIRNWDNSVSTIPPYALVSDSFRNYQPMRSSGGRRVERVIYIDVNSVRFCSEAELRSLIHKGFAADRDSGEAESSMPVNLTLFRHYLENYLEEHDEVNRSMLYMVRQLEQTPSGLPVQLYFFIRTTVWKDFERIQADIFDHIYAVTGEFGLRIFQTPAGRDIESLRNNSETRALDR
ncbi:MAG: mechanosensitive ion channel family protein [Muribaculaceae bacterium]|nr:mechanosensitive ion channel family protein [Muribaculaceae bacterium]